jgi:hypothetical protein
MTNEEGRIRNEKVNTALNNQFSTLNIFALPFTRCFVPLILCPFSNKKAASRGSFYNSIILG